jgi:circadian clock protein KaiC
MSHRLRVRRRPPTGIDGFDEITNGGLPRGRTTLLEGGPGSGKTIFALQFLTHGARHCREPGIFVAFEETSKRVMSNAEGFGWDLAELRHKKKLFFMDAQPGPDLVQSGDFDLSGMLAMLQAQAKEMGAKRIVFDAMDIVLALLPDAAMKRREICRLHEWLLASGLTGLITAKVGGMKASLSAHGLSASCNLWSIALLFSTTASNWASRNAICGCRSFAVPPSTRMNRPS